MARRLFVRLEEDAVHGPETQAPPGTLFAWSVSPVLRRFVSHILIYRESVPAGREIIERVLPDGAVRLVLDLGDSSGGAALQAIGPSAAPAILRLRGELRGLSLTLQPGAAMSLFGVPAGELNERVVALDDVWGRGARERLCDGLDRASSDADRIQAVEVALMAAASRREIDPHPAAVAAWRHLVEANGEVAVRQLADEAGIGERRLQQLFHDVIGLPPRTWRRLARMHGLVRALRRETPRWADAAAMHGFYDQPHLVREFQDLCGCTPGEFLQDRVSGLSNTAP